MTEKADENKRRQAAALAYDPSMAAPQVVAKGYGDIAEQIIAEARRAGVFVHDSPELLGLLMQVDLDDHIPPQLYAAVAEVLSWLLAIQSDR